LPLSFTYSNPFSRGLSIHRRDCSYIVYVCDSFFYQWTLASHIMTLPEGFI
jgi:hypothetical protein